MSKNILSLLSLNTNTNVDNTVDTTPENVMKTVYAPASVPADHTAILFPYDAPGAWEAYEASRREEDRAAAAQARMFCAAMVTNLVVSIIAGYRGTIGCSPEMSGLGFASHFVTTLVASTLLCSVLALAWHYARKALVATGIIALVLATPASAFAQVIQEPAMVSSVTTSVIANAFTGLILAAFVAGAFAGIYTFISKSRKGFQFGVTAVGSLVGAAFIIALAGMLLPYTTTGYVAQDMVAIAMFSAIVLFTGMTAVVWRADKTLTAKEKAAIAAEKARIAKANAEHNAKIEAELEKLGLEASLEAGYNYSVGISQRIINERKDANLGNGCFRAYQAKHGLGVELDWSYGVARSRYLGHWPSDK